MTFGGVQIDGFKLLVMCCGDTVVLLLSVASWLTSSLCV